MKMRMGAEYLALYAIIFGSVVALSNHFRDWDLNFLFVLLGFGFAFVLEGCGREIGAYVPTSKADAKIANEKIRLWVNTLNALAVSLLIAGFAVPLIDLLSDFYKEATRLPTNDLSSFGLIVFGVYVHIRARRVLNYLKDEELSATVALVAP